MDKVAVTEVDWGDKHHTAVDPSAEDQIIIRDEIPGRPQALCEFLNKHSGTRLAIGNGTQRRRVCAHAPKHGDEVLVGNARKLRLIR